MRRYNEAKREKRTAASTGFTPSQREKLFLFIAIWKERVTKLKFVVLVIDVDVKISILVM